MPNRRLERLNEQFRREITGILYRHVRDPRVSNVVITGVAVTSDLWLARIYVRIADDEEQRKEAMKGLSAASSFIRRELGSMLHIRRIPELRFLEDETLDQANRIEEILREVGTPDATDDIPDPEVEQDGDPDVDPNGSLRVDASED